MKEPNSSDNNGIVPELNEETEADYEKIKNWWNSKTQSDKIKFILEITALTIFCLFMFRLGMSL